MADEALSTEERLEKARRERNARKRGRKYSAVDGGNASQFSKCGPNSEVREHPLLNGIKWLNLVGLALVQQGLAWDCRVRTTGWEQTGCLRLDLQRVVHGEVNRLRYIGPIAQPTPQLPIAGGAWQSFPIPVGLANAKDTRALLKLLLTPQQADLVMMGNLPIRAMHEV